MILLNEYLSLLGSGMLLREMYDHKRVQYRHVGGEHAQMSFCVQTSLRMLSYLRRSPHS
jgi:hypothetical protein